MSSKTPAETRDEINELPLRVAWGHIEDPYDESLLRYIRQLGVDDVLIDKGHDTRIIEEGGLDVRELIRIRNCVEDAGLRLNAVEQLPTTSFDKIMLGVDGRERQLETFKNCVRAIGQAGIPILGFHWAANGVWRSSKTFRVRGDAYTTAYNHDELKDVPNTHSREFTEEELWDAYEWFLERIIPVAEEAGVKLALHPNDPPIDGLGGVPYLFRDLQTFKRGINEIHPSENLGLKMCFGCWSEMADVDPLEAIEHFGEKIFYVHFRDVQGEGKRFNETFIDAGDNDMYEAIKAFKRAGATPALTPDHVPKMEGDTDTQHRGYAYTLGYMKGILDAANWEEHESGPACY
jgi:mannonate dehydratase